MLKVIVLVIFALLFAALSLYAETLPTTVSSLAKDETRQGTDAEIASLRAQLALTREFDDRLVSTVHWSLAVTIAVLLAMLGFGWYSNYRIYERDKAALQSELERSASDRWAQLNLKLESITANQAAYLKRTGDEQTTRISQRLEEQRHQSEEFIKKSIESVDRELRAFRFKFLEFLSDTQTESKEFVAYVAHRDFLKEALRDKFDSKITKALERIIGYIQPRLEFYYDDMSELRRLSEELPSACAPYKERLLAELSRLNPRRAAL
jgi:hypothetical protein